MISSAHMTVILGIQKIAQSFTGSTFHNHHQFNNNLKMCIDFLSFSTVWRFFNSLVGSLDKNIDCFGCPTRKLLLRNWPQIRLLISANFKSKGTLCKPAPKN
jgi:hypothetical protein